MLTNHMVFTPMYRGRILKGQIKEDCTALMYQICRENGVQVIDLAIGANHVHLFIRYPVTRCEGDYLYIDCLDKTFQITSHLFLFYKIYDLLASKSF